MDDPLADLNDVSNAADLGGQATAVEAAGSAQKTEETKRIEELEAKLKETTMALHAMERRLQDVTAQHEAALNTQTAEMKELAATNAKLRARLARIHQITEGIVGGGVADWTEGPAAAVTEVKKGRNVDGELLHATPPLSSSSSSSGASSSEGDHKRSRTEASSSSADDDVVFGHTLLIGPFAEIAKKQRFTLEVIEASSAPHFYSALFPGGVPFPPHDRNKRMDHFKAQLAQWRRLTKEEVLKEAEDLDAVLLRMLRWSDEGLRQTACVTNMCLVAQPPKRQLCSFCKNALRVNPAVQYVTATHDTFHLVCGYVYSWIDD